MMEPIRRGDKAAIIAGALGDKGPNVGEQVVVGFRMGEHSQHGAIWRVYSEGLITEYGAMGASVDCAASWLKKIDPPKDKAQSAQAEKSCQN